MPASKNLKTCKHASIHLDVSSNAADAGFKRPSKHQRICAASHDGTYPTTQLPITPLPLFDDAATFPAPLVLPDDDLDIDPEWPPQSVKEWRDEEERNVVTMRRKTIYLVGAPEITDEMAPMREWTAPLNSANTVSATDPAMELDIGDCKEYIAAFYHGMPIKILKKKFTWQAWEYESASKSNPKPKYNGKLLKLNQTQLIGLRTPQNTVVGIRCRLSPDKVAMQVNLDDILDALAENIPKDAYAIMMLLNLDMYEGDDDIFTGGRAYGGSRIAVVSSFRDNPQHTAPDTIHRWPASHCKPYIANLCGEPKKKDTRVAQPSGPIAVAIQTVAQLPPDTPSQAIYAEWFSRVAQTMTHELGHCMGLDHCVYYACVMQGCASSAEALRQPPYLCPICLEKLAWGIGAVVKQWGSDKARRAFVKERYEAMRRVCERWAGESRGVFWVGYEVWLGGIVAMMG